MIFYLVTRNNVNVINWYLEQWGQPLVSLIRPVYYDQITRQRKLPSGTYIFSDIERLSPQDAEKAAWIWTQLSQIDSGVRLLNHPLWSMCRYELLRTLYNQNINQFNIYRLTEDPKPQRFPVFVRGENDHSGNQTALLETMEDLDHAIAEIVQQGQNRQNKVIIEFCDTRDAQGLFKKYSAFTIGEQIIPVHVRYQNNWVVKAQTLNTEAREAENKDYVTNNPHEQQLREIFKTARIQYGRIDYSLLDDQIQVWEINTNPTICHFSNTIDSHPLNSIVASNLQKAFEAINLASNLTNVISNHHQPTEQEDNLEFVSVVSHWFQWLPKQQQVNLRKTLRKLKSKL
ncbi:hypothetical protein PN462_04715 [Spirulina sp. CS-785/01]|uniref:hypothetical protein n=1 Tax=Spirulina sp. CS-785/01 TaxID=3021716 RepID=UPI00232DD7FB|nr:hypothetical protein [Spirulina sp. CS-785/01]MDB9312397.1 hypothetical protein [Spirulina sp. CS-785/01]